MTVVVILLPNISPSGEFMKTREGILLGEIYKKDNTETFVIYKILFKVLKSRERETHFSTLLWKIKYYFFLNFFFLFIF